MSDYEMKFVSLTKAEYTDISNDRSFGIYVEHCRNQSRLYLSKGSTWSNGESISWNDVEEIRKNVDDYLTKTKIEGCLTIIP